MQEVEIVRYPQMSGLNIFLDTVEYRTPHIHLEYELLWVLEGTLGVGGENLDCSAPAGELLLMNPQQTHEFTTAGRNCTFLCFQVAPSFFSPFYPEMTKLFFDRPLLCAGLSQAGERQVKRSLALAADAYLSQPQGYELLCAGHLQLAFAGLLAAVPWHLQTREEATDRRKKTERLNRLMQFVDENYMHKVRLSDFARSEGLSTGYLSHFVKDALNQSFQDYVNTVRFNSARRMIEQGEPRMLDVCMASGFSDYRYFCRTFVERLGVTPEAYSREPRRHTEDAGLHHSLHSLEQFYSRTRSIEMLHHSLGAYL